jgi:hypothetical protein
MSLLNCNHLVPVRGTLGPGESWHDVTHDSVMTPFANLGNEPPLYTTLSCGFAW